MCLCTLNDGLNVVVCVVVFITTTTGERAFNYNYNASLALLFLAPKVTLGIALVRALGTAHK